MDFERQMTVSSGLAEKRGKLSVNMCFEAYVGLLRCFVGLMLLVSGLIHTSQPYLYYGAILRYDLVAPNLSLLIAVVLPAFSLAVGCSLIMNVWMRQSLIMAATLFGVFAMAQWSAIYFDRSIACGCFGISSGQVTIASAGLVSIGCIALIHASFLLSSSASTGDGRELTSESHGSD